MLFPCILFVFSRINQSLSSISLLCTVPGFVNSSKVFTLACTAIIHTSPSPADGLFVYSKPPPGVAHFPRNPEFPPTSWVSCVYPSPPLSAIATFRSGFRISAIARDRGERPTLAGVSAPPRLSLVCPANGTAWVRVGLNASTNYRGIPYIVPV